MRAPLIVVVFAVVIGVLAYFFFKTLQPVAEAPPPPPVPEARRTGADAFALFMGICVDGRATHEETTQRAIAAGYTVTPDHVNPKLGSVMALSRTTGIPPGVTDITLNAYAHPQLSSMLIRGERVHGCYVYDFEARYFPEEANGLEAMLGPPRDHVAQPGEVETRTWVGPEDWPEVDTLRMGFIEHDGPIHREVGFSGLTFAITSTSR
jgi:hypothetical protein